MGKTGNELQAAVVAQIKAEMDDKDWNQKDLAAASGVPTSTLSRYLGGSRDMPTPVVVDIGAALGLTFPELLVRAQLRSDGTP
jgi:transcriptional regulator with XRE-family HTH domain